MLGRDAMNHSERAPGGSAPRVAAPPHRPCEGTFIWIRIRLFVVVRPGNSARRSDIFMDFGAEEAEVQIGPRRAC